jgi:hypothetical protein
MVAGPRIGNSEGILAGWSVTAIVGRPTIGRNVHSPIFPYLGCDFNRTIS